MIGDFLKDPRAGDPFPGPSAARERLVNRSVRDYLSRQSGNRAGVDLVPQDADVVTVVNNTGSPIARFGVMGIDSPLNPPAGTSGAATDAFSAAIQFNGVVPAASAHLGRFAIALLPIPPSATGPALVNGATPVRLAVQNETDGYADIADGAIDKLQTGSTGGVKILWKESSGSTRWGVVSFGGSSLPVPQYQHMALQAVSQNQLGADFIRAHNMNT